MREQLLDSFKGISIWNVLSHITVPRHQRCRDQVLGFVVDKFIELAQRVAVMDDKTLMLPTGLPLKDNFCRKVVMFRLFQQLLGDKVFPAIIRPQLGDPHFKSNICTVNSELGYVDPKLDEASICDVMDYEFGRDLSTRATTAAHVAKHFDYVEKNWPQPVNLETKLDCTWQFRDGMKWTKSRTCAVCTRELKCGDLLKTNIYKETEIERVCKRLNFHLLKFEDNDQGVALLDHPVLARYMLDGAGWVDRKLIVCLECE
ncbi:hypothetical protein EV421DRAFT_1742359 [Armillaria borealis]|uniref:Uncharacterized protein n=1 Tax=Armillaria borealis TaxID=47425 RepID=A0AA39MEZ0_9AGAR|nr:hypothetical protein EV421DRAFT_1742359 [Armillaria borealis]